ncbi:hypothetical protein K501DRAFT_232169 [Backusella circina FSU 941]|nr:hypothetical protein K501DRAFT_232169 [Backusella circina FSU 941]
MTSVTEAGESNSWLKQRSSIFNGSNTPKAAKVVDKELARLKSSGVVSSIWSNKFVQEDNPGVPKRASLNALLQKDATSPKSASFGSLFNKQRSSLEADKTEITKTDNFVENQQITPENKIALATSLVQANINNDSVTESNTTTNISTVAVSPIQATMDKEEQKVDNTPAEALVDEAIIESEQVTSHSVDALEKEIVVTGETFIKEFSEVSTPSVAATATSISITEESVKTDVDDVKPMDEVTTDNFVKEEDLEQSIEIKEIEESSFELPQVTTAESSTIAKVTEEGNAISHLANESADIPATDDAKEIKQNQSSREAETAQVAKITHDASVSATSFSPFASSGDSLDTAAALWFQIETLKTKYAQEHARLERAYQDIEFYKHQLEMQSEMNKESLANAMEEKEKEALRVRQLAELIVKQDQLLNEYENNLAVLTRLTDEATYLHETQTEIDGLRQELVSLNQQKKNMQGAIDSLRGELEMSYSQMRLVMAVSTEIQNDFEKHKEISNKQLQDTLEQKDSEHQQFIQELQQQIKTLTDSHQDTLEQTSEVSTSTVELDALKEEVAQLKKALDQKEVTIQSMEQQMQDQKTDLEGQIMELSQTIIEKDAHLLEIMNSRNNSESSIIGHMPPPPDSLYDPEHRYSYGHSPIESQFHINQVRDYMLSSSDEEDDDEEDREVLHLSYSSDEDDMMMHHNAPLESPGTNSITSTITFGSSEEEEKMSDLKHFSYTSVHSQKDNNDIPETLSEQPVGARDSFIAKENSSKWPMPPPTPPPSEPLPPVPHVVAQPLEKIDTVVPPPRRARSKTLVNSQSSSPVSNELPRIIPLQKSTPPVFETATPVPPPRKNIPQRSSMTQQTANLAVDHANEIDGYQHTKWMDDPESEDDRVKDDWKTL